MHWWRSEDNLQELIPLLGGSQELNSSTKICSRYLYPLNCLTAVSCLTKCWYYRSAFPLWGYHTEFMDMGLLAHFQPGSAFISFGY